MIEHWEPPELHTAFAFQEWPMATEAIPLPPTVALTCKGFKTTLKYAKATETQGGVVW